MGLRGEPITATFLSQHNSSVETETENKTKQKIEKGEIKSRKAN